MYYVPTEQDFEYLDREFHEISQFRREHFEIRKFRFFRFCDFRDLKFSNLKF